MGAHPTGTVPDVPKVTVNGIELHYEMTRSGPPLLLLHGLGSSGWDWEDQVAHFSNTHSVITTDFRGHGSSEKPPGPYSIAEYSSDTAALIDELGVAPVTVVGISLGGMVGFQMAADHPELIDRLVVVNAVPEFKVEGIGFRVQIAIRKLLTRLVSMAKIGEILAGLLFPEDGMEEQRHKMVERWSENEKRDYQNAFRAILTWPGVGEAMSGFHRPTLFIVSDEDYTPVDSKRPYVEATPNASMVVIDNARHAVPVECEVQRGAGGVPQVKLTLSRALRGWPGEGRERLWCRSPGHPHRPPRRLAYPGPALSPS